MTSQMINSERNGNAGNIGRAGSPASDKQHPAALKKTALRDVQNENVGLTHKSTDGFLFGGRLNSDAIKVCGTKRLTPECPLECQVSLALNGANENVMNARRRFELELGRGRLHSHMEKYSDIQSRHMCQLPQEVAQKQSQIRESNNHRAPPSTSNHMATMMTFSSGVPAAPGYTIGNLNNNVHSPESSRVKVSSELPHKLDSKGSINDQISTEHFIRLQKFLKQCDEASPKEYIQMLLHLSPAELSKHAVELEKRAIQLTIEEGKEMKRVKALNVLGRSAPTGNSLQSTHSNHPASK